MRARQGSGRVGITVLMAVLLGLAGWIRTGGPVRAAGAAVPSIEGNWAGYVATGSRISAVRGSWIVPPAGSRPPGLSATWTGIGGFSTSDLIQAGTLQASSPLDQTLGMAPYSAWYELLPAGPVYIQGCAGSPSCAVRPGDQMTAAISTGGGSRWTIRMADAGHWSYSTTVTYVSSESSAEWIHEAPSLLGAVPVPVGSSGTVRFDGTNSATVNRVVLTVAAARSLAVVALPVETTPSALDRDGDSFNVCTYSLSCAPSPS